MSGRVPVFVDDDRPWVSGRGVVEGPRFEIEYPVDQGEELLRREVECETVVEPFRDAGGRFDDHPVPISVAPREVSIG